MHLLPELQVGKLSRNQIPPQSFRNPNQVKIIEILLALRFNKQQEIYAFKFSIENQDLDIPYKFYRVASGDPALVKKTGNRQQHMDIGLTDLFSILEQLACDKTPRYSFELPGYGRIH
ncbi:hypothetical protein CFP56_024946 [Quercus suber]|uniref:Uncharacterized protein n=1 Tax=Quercus suber TaxID=58331 RepID=A0AAW0LWQ3_QUESU